MNTLHLRLCLHPHPQTHLHLHTHLSNAALTKPPKSGKRIISRFRGESCCVFVPRLLPAVPLMWSQADTELALESRKKKPRLAIAEDLLTSARAREVACRDDGICVLSTQFVLPSSFPFVQDRVLQSDHLQKVLGGACNSQLCCTVQLSVPRLLSFYSKVWGEQRAPKRMNIQYRCGDLQPMTSSFDLVDISCGESLAVTTNPLLPQTNDFDMPCDSPTRFERPYEGLIAVQLACPSHSTPPRSKPGGAIERVVIIQTGTEQILNATSPHPGNIDQHMLIWPLLSVAVNYWYARSHQYKYLWIHNPDGRVCVHPTAGTHTCMRVRMRKLCTVLHREPKKDTTSINMEFASQMVLVASVATRIPSAYSSGMARHRACNSGMAHHRTYSCGIVCYWTYIAAWPATVHKMYFCWLSSQGSCTLDGVSCQRYCTRSKITQLSSTFCTSTRTHTSPRHVGFS